MKVEHLYDLLSGNGIFTTLNDGKLVVKAAKGVLTPKFIELIKSNKPALLDYLSKQASYTSNEKYPEISIIKRNKEELYPLSYNQQRLWFIDHLEGGSANYNIPMAYTFVGDLDLKVAQQAFEKIVERHEILRTTYTAVDGIPMQFVRPAGDFSIQYIDLTHLPQNQQISKVQSLAKEDAKKIFDLENDLMVRASLVSLSPIEQVAQTVLLLNFHHIAFDGWSFGIFLREFVQN
ncbi:condensation domain-containing protein, partial [Shewanella sp.]|uniref:condensation domain-containing protein n=1 Tax=Shewanella sp. TaxID=50422 RepID=UPI0040539BAF